MKIGETLSIADLKHMARRRLPKVMFDLIESGVEDELGIERNEAAFREYRFLPRALADVSRRDQSVSLFGQRYASPFGISPTGVAALFRRDADFMLAQAAADADIPFILSGACMARPEDVIKSAPRHTWFQVYAARDPAISADFVRRARDAGCRTLVLTVDTPLLPKRERDMRNGAALPPRPRLGLLVEALLHPGWLLEYLLRGGMPRMESWAPYAGRDADAAGIVEFFRQQSPSVQTWKDLDEFRRLWPGELIVKGILHPDDAMRAVQAGASGIMVSNHGGKTLDRAPATIEALPAVCARVGDRVPVMLDCGVRRGSDIVVAACLGARQVFVGRASLYGVAAAAHAGAKRALDILRHEVDLTLGLLGCPAFSDLGRQHLFEAANPPPSGKPKLISASAA